MNCRSRFIVTSVILFLFTGTLLAQSRGHENKPSEMQNVVDGLLRAAQKAMVADFEQLVLPDASAWFKASFGEKAGTYLGTLYERRGSDGPIQLMSLFASALLPGKPKVNVMVVGTDLGSDIALMKVLVRPLSEVQMYRVFLEHRDDSRNVDVGYFVYRDGHFRYLGRIYVIQENEAKQMLFLGPEAAVQHPILKARLRPRYPAAAKQARVQGVVLLQAIIREDGALEDVQVIQGDALFAGPTQETIAKWTYRPLQVNGKTYKAVTLIPVSFTLRF